MKLSLPTRSRPLLVALLMIVLGACEDPTDPWDRIQGEPTEELIATDRAPDGSDVAGAAHDVEDIEDDH